MTDTIDDSRLDTRVSVLEANVTNIKDTLIRMDARFERLESDMRFGFEKMEQRFEKAEIKRERDFRITFSAIIFSGIGTAGIVAHAMKWL